MGERDPTLVVVGEQRHSPDNGRWVEERSAERPPVDRSRFGKSPSWAALPLDVIVCLGALVATALCLLLVLSQLPSLP